MTLHSGNDVDYRKFTVTSGDFDLYYTGVVVNLEAGVPLTASLYLAGTMLATATGKSIELAVPQAQPGDYFVEISGTSVNAYDLRARVYDPRSRIRALALEQWLENATLPHPPAGPLPDAGVVFGPLPDPIDEYPFDDLTVFALGRNGVMPLPEGQTVSELDVPADSGGPRMFAVGSSSGGTSELNVEATSSAPSGDCGGLPTGLYAMMIDSDGRELWREEGAATSIHRVVLLPAGRTSLLLINGCYRMKLRVSLGAPGPFIPGDFTGDGYVDGSDVDVFEACATGPGILGPPAGCALADFTTADFDRDADVDQSDFSVLQRCFSGAGEPADPNCAN